MKAIRIISNTKGTRFALVSAADGTFGVWKECKNYSAHVRGGLAVTWRYCEINMARGAAETLLGRKGRGAVQ